MHRPTLHSVRSHVELSTGLRFSQRVLWKLRIKEQTVAAVEFGLTLAGYALVLGIVVAVFSRLFNGLAIWLEAYLVVVVLGIAAAVTRPILKSLFVLPTLADVAERLDLATGGQNRAATAAEFLAADSEGVFEQAAIRDGLQHLQAVQHTIPWSHSPRIRFGRDGVLVSACLASAAAIALLLNGSRRGADLVLPGRLAETLAVEALPAGAVVRPQPATPPVDHTRPADAIASTASNPGSEASRAGSKPQAGVGSAVGGSATDASAGASYAEAPQAPDSPGQAGDEASLTMARHSARAQLASGTVAPVPVASGGAGSEHGAPPGGSNKSAPLPSGRSPGPSQGKAVSGQASGGAPPPDAGTPEPNKGNGDGPGAESDEPTPDSSGFSNSPTDPTDVMGDGRAVGQSQPKKARGVAPLLLETRQPDLLEGRALPGPDERAKLQLPTRRDPQPPAAAAAAVGRTGDERPADRYRVPAESRVMVSAYFEGFHADPGSTSTSTSNKDQ